MKLIIFLLLTLISDNSLAWQDSLKKEVAQIDNDFPGEIGIVIKDLNSGSLLEYNADKNWYLSSTMKIFIALTLMKEIDAGKINLTNKIKLKEEHFVDGAGPVLWSKPGESFTVAYLLKAMLEESDNTAADMLFNLVGEKKINQNFKKWAPGAGAATSLLDVRYLAYTELHPKAKSLTNMDFIHFKNASVSERPQLFAEKVGIPVTALKVKRLEEAHENFYSRQYNSAPLQSFVTLLEELAKGNILSPKSTELILHHMTKMKTGENRVKAGLAPDSIFMQKTGTQIHRACNVGLIRKRSESKSRVALAVCIKKPSETLDSDTIFKKIGQKIEASALI